MIYDLITNHIWFMYTSIALFSLAVGSLLNVVIYRLPIMLEREWKQQYNDLTGIREDYQQPINLFFPRSFCPSCNATVKAWQNIPILSYLFLHGRCYQCKAPISIRYPLIELITMLFSLYASWHFGFTVQLIFALIAIWILICLIFIDLDHQILPDCLTLSLLWIGLIANTENLFTPLPQAVLSAAGAYMGLWMFIKIFYLFTGKIGMGNGDFKLFAAFGAWFGWIFLPLILLLSSISGTIIGLLYLRLHDKSKDTTIPFGPFLCISGLISLFWGHHIVSWYLHFWM
ncbi:A24 family peptidase [Legionella anisa]|uniref:Prepilin leader peptidase/N-methyltransferase n=1 Tax=Legionella anisa TaxID=28082 RepID=A0AAX0WTQ0_9GAMM|nr:A24 family peptidase [Legionella anisa]AWN74293.1 prepilin peptidase [Legionella anisa]KTC72028.1 Type 4 prepilin-like proteins leader peptide processing enzyme [Legionella anisa]MBN5934261.1 prepilin peptidase [Legionella anisa]MCW8425671.1 A24 family peptidase [Legionella anisa]MCW8448900.1 A24 family peptidase [Legionella anisa]